MREITIGGTGHRCDKFQKGYSYDTKESILIKTLVVNAFFKIVFENETIPTNKEDLVLRYDKLNVIVGGALGFDELMLLGALDFKNIYGDIIQVNITVAAPHKDWYKVRPKRTHKAVEELNARADDVIYVDTIEGYQMTNMQQGVYHPDKNKLRNQYMVDNSKLMLALFEGSYGGTYSCIYYCKKVGRDVFNLWDIFQQKLKEIK